MAEGLFRASIEKFQLNSFCDVDTRWFIASVWKELLSDLCEIIFVVDMFMPLQPKCQEDVNCSPQSFSFSFNFSTIVFVAVYSCMFLLL